MVDPYLLKRAIEAYGTWQNTVAAGATHLKEFEDALRTLVQAGATADEVAEIIPDGASWIDRIASMTPGLEAACQPLCCSFCQKAQLGIRKLIAGPGVYICNDCVARLAREMTTIAPQRIRRCSFCGRDRACIGERETTHICQDCLDLCAQILQSAFV